MAFENMTSEASNVVYYVCSVDDKLKICQPAMYLPVTFEGADYPESQYLAGFAIFYPELGKFEGMVEGSDMCVYYRHLKAGQQIIAYYSTGVTNKVFYIVLDGIKVHDHSSIQQGGPAYATYYSRIREEMEEES